MRRWIVIAAAAALAACQSATSEGFDRFASVFVGQPERAIIDRFGVPDRSYSTGGSKYLAFTRSRTFSDPGVAPSYQSTAIGNTIYTKPIGGIGPSLSTVECTLTFRLEHGAVAGYSFRGEACRA